MLWSYLELFLAHIGSSTITELLLPKSHDGEGPSALSKLVDQLKLIMTETTHHESSVIFRVICVLAKYLEKECMDAIEIMVIPISLHDTDKVRQLRTLLKVRGYLLPETWSKVFILATALMQCARSQSLVSWGTPNANLLRLTTASHRDGPSALWKLLCGHSDVLRDVHPMEQIKRLGPIPKSPYPCPVADMKKCFTYSEGRRHATKNCLVNQLLAVLIISVSLILSLMV